ncbi:hypothetical protein V2H45_22230 [Tumidithrix elongata RA019]|uniref:Uncharacterized protein n=1 Tax=Tumidithrix elongata BACA0141 TaxID=2716417 RepID=A0AAW9QAC3_9CYAN|nr:hypothetical protein [Tumidithrix elongata RA019]
MSTRALIGKQIGENEYLSIYLHHDGYVEYAGLILHDYYSMQERVDRLLALGDMSVISQSPDDCSFYANDRKNPWEEVKPKTRTLQELCSESWVYVWDGTQWLGSESSMLNLVTIPELLNPQSSYEYSE